MTAKPWFRWYRGTITDPKMKTVARYASEDDGPFSLSDVIAIWAVVLELTGDDSVTRPFGCCNDALDALSECVHDHIGVDNCYAVLRAMIDLGLLEQTETEIKVKNWEKRQTFDTTAAERMKRYRQRKSDATVTPELRDTETDTYTDTNTEKTPRAMRANGYSSSFLMFWKSYPIKKGKRQAFLAFQRASKRAMFEEIMAGCITLAQEVANGRDTRYVKHASTWLNADGWLDEPDAEPAPLPEIDFDDPTRSRPTSGNAHSEFPPRLRGPHADSNVIEAAANDDPES